MTQEKKPRPKKAVADTEETPSSTKLVQIQPIRSYFDEGEVRHPWGKSYATTRANAAELVAHGLAKERD